MANRTPLPRLWRPAVAAAAALTVTAGVVAATPRGSTAPAAPRLSLIAASTAVTLDSWKEDPGVYLDLGTYLTADGAPLEFRVTRKSYTAPVVAAQVIREGGRTRTKALPAGLVKDFAGLPGFVSVTLTDKAGRKVLSRTESFCPNNASGRIRPDAPARSAYPESCPVNPFTLGSVWGVEKGWASNTYAGYYSAPVTLPAGKYTAKVSVTKRYRDLFKIADKPRTINVTVRERSWEEESTAGRSPAARSASGQADHTAGHAAHAAAGHAPAASPHPGHAGHTMTRTPAPASATSGAGPSYNVGHGPLVPAPAAV
ncbi:protein-lysine 6-oxidase, partial [Streptomyces sp. NPDC005899]